MSVDEYAAVVAFEGVGDDLFADCVEEVLLLGGGGEDTVEGEGVLVEFDFGVGVEDGLVVAAGLDPDDYLN